MRLAGRSAVVVCRPAGRPRSLWPACLALPRWRRKSPEEADHAENKSGCALAATAIASGERLLFLRQAHCTYSQRNAFAAQRSTAQHSAASPFVPWTYRSALPIEQDLACEWDHHVHDQDAMLAMLALRCPWESLVAMEARPLLPSLSPPLYAPNHLHAQSLSTAPTTHLCLRLLIVRSASMTSLRSMLFLRRKGMSPRLPALPLMPALELAKRRPAPKRDDDDDGGGGDEEGSAAVAAFDPSPRPAAALLLLPLSNVPMLCERCRGGRDGDGGAPEGLRSEPPA